LIVSIFFFFQLIKYVQESDDDYKNLKMAHRVIIDLIKAINTEVGKRDDLEKLEWLEEHIKMMPVNYH
jgi:hypothetical protein